MKDTINGETLIDDKGNLNEQTWFDNCIAVGELLAELYSDKEGADDEQGHHIQRRCDSVGKN